MTSTPIQNVHKGIKMTLNMIMKEYLTIEYENHIYTTKTQYDIKHCKRCIEYGEDCGFHDSDDMKEGITLKELGVLLLLKVNEPTINSVLEFGIGTNINRGTEFLKGMEAKGLIRVDRTVTNYKMGTGRRGLQYTYGDTIIIGFNTYYKYHYSTEPEDVAKREEDAKKHAEIMAKIMQVLG